MVSCFCGRVLLCFIIVKMCFFCYIISLYLHIIFIVIIKCFNVFEQVDCYIFFFVVIKYYSFKRLYYHFLLYIVNIPRFVVNALNLLLFIIYIH